VSPDPQVRIGVLLNARRVTIGGGGGLRVTDPLEGELRTTAAGASADAVVRGADVSLLDTGGPVTRPVLVIEPVDAGSTLRLNGRDYRGTLELRRTDSGFTVINSVPLEGYLAGVVAAELGTRSRDDFEALKAQAVVSRTYAIRNQARWRDRGYDLNADASDQIYTGQFAEDSLATAAVAATRGQILTWNHQPIDAFFSSTCGGRTEDGVAAFAGARRPYLRSVDDLDPTGTPWCAISPRYHWTAGWTATQLASTLRRTLAAEGLPGGRAGELTDIQIASHTASGRIAAVELVGRNGETPVSGQAIRRVLSPVEGGLLRSTNFTIRITRSGGTIERVDIDGQGNGHGVGMCQWGAIGRSRAGEDYQTILASYFPGTEIEPAY
jgi:stage II sporulation protein D